jgi:hypothetical protein
MSRKAVLVNLLFQVCSRSKLLRSLLAQLVKVSLILSVQANEGERGPVNHQVPE